MLEITAPNSLRTTHSRLKTDMTVLCTMVLWYYGTRVFALSYFHRFSLAISEDFGGPSEISNFFSFFWHYVVRRAKTRDHGQLRLSLLYISCCRGCWERGRGLYEALVCSGKTFYSGTRIDIIRLYWLLLQHVCKSCSQKVNDLDNSNETNENNGESVL